MINQSAHKHKLEDKFSNEMWKKVNRWRYPRSRCSEDCKISCEAKGWLGGGNHCLGTTFYTVKIYRGKKFLYGCHTKFNEWLLNVCDDREIYQEMVDDYIDCRIRNPKTKAREELGYYKWRDSLEKIPFDLTCRNADLHMGEEKILLELICNNND